MKKAGQTEIADMDTSHLRGSLVAENIDTPWLRKVREAEEKGECPHVVGPFRGVPHCFRCGAEWPRE